MNQSSFQRIAEFISKGIQRVVVGCTSVILFYIIILGIVGVGGRWLGLKIPSWVDVQIRYLTLWIALRGAILATYKGQHISIDLVDYVFPTHIRQVIRRFIALLSAIVAFFLSLLALRFLSFETQTGTQISKGGFGKDLPLWAFAWVFPMCFLLMAVEFFINALWERRKSS
ncbi:MAG: TRAP transporter small permease [bacterium]